MKCEQAREFISVAADGELSASENLELTAHLSQCADCATYRTLVGPLKRRVAGIGALDAGTAEAVLARVLGGVVPEGGIAGRAAPGAFRAQRLLYAAAAVVLLAAGVFAVMSAVAPTRSVAATVVRQHRMHAAGQVVLDTAATCCRDLEDWFEAKAGRPVDVPEITYPGTLVQGGKLYKHTANAEIYCAAFIINGKPVTLWVCSGPNMTLPEGQAFSNGKLSAVMARGEDYTLFAWQSGAEIDVLVTSFDEDLSKEIFASIK